MGTIDEIKERLDIVDLISTYVPLKKAGRTYKGLCPFHSEKTPSFIVFPETQTWKCFGCGAGGDLFGFVMRREGLDFGEALRQLAERAGVVIAPRSEAAKGEAALRERLIELNDLAAKYFHHFLVDSPEGARARDYLVHRGISDTTREQFLLGYARDDWQALGTHLTAKGNTWAHLLEAGLVVEREGGGYYDRFRGRLVFPIRDRGGQIVGFGARALDDSVPKYLNSPQTAVFDKGGVLYGIDQAKDAIRDSGLVVIVEGYMDVLMAHQYGRKNVVASMGTALTERQIRIIKKLSKKLVLALDADAAGNQATLRGLELAQESFDKRAVPIPTWRGLIRYEEQLDAEIRVASLPAGLDPDEVIKADVDRWDALIGNALPVVEYYLQSVLSSLDLNSPKGKVEAAREVLPLIREIGSSVERSHYLQYLARLLHVDERALQQEMMGKLPARPQTELPERRGRLSGQAGLMMGPERYVLLLMLRQPALLKRMNDLLAKLDLEPLSGEDFGGTEERALFQSMSAHVVEWGTADAKVHAGEFEVAVQQELNLLVQLMDGLSSLSEDQLEQEAAMCVLRLREARLRRYSEQLGSVQQDARLQEGPEATRQWGQIVNGLANQLVRVQREKAMRSSLRLAR